jgi:glycosyltransferase involved in cell wall biosynthesis
VSRPHAGPLVFCSKSPWTPAVRREHALAQEAATRGHAVTFVEQPADIRSARRGWGARTWLAGLRAAGREWLTAEGVRVVGRSVVVPGHRDALAQRVQVAQLERTLRRHAPGGSTVVCCVPWDWPAVAAAPAARRAFDMADDWGELMPGRRERFTRLYQRIAQAADAIAVVNDDLRRHFPGREVHVVRNGVPAWMVDAPALAGARAGRRLLYVGTLSPRFDAPLIGAVLDLLPGWGLDLVGACLYPGRRDGPGDELATLLQRPDVHWHGPLPRAAVVARMDATSVLVVPNRLAHSAGQDSMKLYDYAARGRPIVASCWDNRLEAAGPPHLLVADGPEAFAAAVLSADAQPPAYADDRRRWAAANTWSARWPTWRAAILEPA